MLALILTFTRDIGTEGHLACLLFSFYGLVKAGEMTEQSERSWTKTLIIVLLFLTRIDFLFSVIPFLILGEIFSRTTSRSSVLIISLSVTVAAAVYFLSNYLNYHHLMTVSGSIESSFPSIVLVQNLGLLITSQLNQGLRLLFLFFIFAVFIFLFFTKRLTDSVSEFDGMLVAAGAGSIAFCLMHEMFNHSGLREWYTAMPLFVALMMTGRISSLLPRMTNILIKVLIPVLVFYLAIVRVVYLKWNSAYDYALQLKQKTPPTSAIFQIDASGVVGFFAERSVVDGDGLANSYEYADYLKFGKLGEYLRSAKIQYYSTYSAIEKHDSLGSPYFVDYRYEHWNVGYDFIFPEGSIVFSMPFRYRHVLLAQEGKWNLFKLERP